MNHSIVARCYFNVVVQLIVLVGLLSACQDADNLPAQADSSQAYIDSGDFDAIKSHGVLRVLRPRMLLQKSSFPRHGLPLENQSELISAFADSEKLQLDWVVVDDYGDLIPALLEGRGDIIVANMTATQERRNEIAFTLPVDMVREKLVTSSKLNITQLAQLKNHDIAVKASTSYWETAQDIVKHFPQINVSKVDEKMSYSELLELVAAGKHSATILDSNVLNAIALDEHKLSSLLTLARGREIAWGVRKNATELRQRVNLWLQSMSGDINEDQIHREDFNGIKQRKVLRVLTRNNAANYYLWRGQLVGFEYELMKKFSKQHQLRLEMIVVPDREQLWEWLKQGKGDIIAASITRRELDGFLFSDPYNIVDEVIVARDSEPMLRNLNALAGREIVARPGSSYWQRIKALQLSGVNVKLKAVPESMETEKIIDNVAKGIFDLTVADSHILGIELAWRQDIIGGPVLKSGLQHGWVVRDNNLELLKELNRYIKSIYRGVFYNSIRDKYFKQAGKNIKTPGATRGWH